MKAQIVFMTDSSEIENLINKNFDLPEPFEMAVSEEANNYSYKVYDIDGEYDEEDIANLVAGDTMFLTREALCNLCSRGIIEPGTYVVDMSW